MNGQIVIMRYVKALYEAALAEQAVADVREDLLRINAIISEAAPIREYCLKFRVNRVQEMAFIATAFIPYIGKLTAEMLKIAVRNGRLEIIPYLLEAFNVLQDKAAGVAQVVIESAQQLKEGVNGVLKAKMEQRLGKKIKLTSIIIPELIGGVRIVWENRMIDLSVAGRLRRMKAVIRAS